MRPRLLALACLALMACQPSPSFSQDQSPADRFKAIYTKEWTQRQGGQQGNAENGGGGEGGGQGGRGGGRLPHVDAATQAAKLAYLTDIMKQLDTVDPATLTGEDKVNYEVYHEQIQVMINTLKFREYEKPLNSDTFFWNIGGGGRRQMRSAQQYEAYIAMLNDIPRYFDEQIVNMRAGLKRGFTPPAVTLIGRDATLATIAEAKTPDDCTLFTPFKNMPANMHADEAGRIRAAGLKAVRDSALPAYQKLLKFIREEYFPGARKELAAESLPDGKAYYQSLILEYTTTTLTPAQIHQIGLDEMAKIHAEMLDTMKEANFTGDFPAFLTFLRTDPQFYAKTPEELMMRASYIAKQFDGKVSQYFGYIPRQRFAIVPVPMDLAPTYTSARGGPGTYLVNTYDLPSRALYSLPALTLHESAPGHAFQMPIIAENHDLPPFRRVYISAYGEGWALYCERLGTEMGMYHTPYEKFGMLSYQAWRAARLVVDTGIHSMGWTREQAMTYLQDNTALSKHEIETETDRYISWPGQSLSYYLGQMEIQKDRAKAEAALGDKFNIKAFHDTVLQMGGVPLPVLGERMDRFIAEGGKGPYPDMER